MSKKKSVPDIIFDRNDSSLKLIKEHYLGKGAFGQCYALKCAKTGKMFAGKFLNKNEIEKYSITDKIIQEINIHKSVNHQNIVRFESCIEDEEFIYIILELCSNRSMSELIRSRKCVQTFEAKYFMKQVVSAVLYLHEKKIIHRDLKLANLFINSDMIIKVGDFGVAVKVTDELSMRRSLCGTPNYIAPEVLSRKGHSYEVDIWALGCILYTLLIGIPPFETNSVEKTYELISKCQYNLPNSINLTASSFIRCSLQKDPEKRPSIKKLSDHDFLNVGFIPKRLPPSCVVMPPRIKMLLKYNRQTDHLPEHKDIRFSSQALPHSEEEKLTNLELLELLRNLNRKIKIILSDYTVNNTDDSQNPSLQPFLWVNSWSYDLQKNGFGYRLNDNCVGTLFNDNSTVLVLPKGNYAYYIYKDGTECLYTLEDIKTLELNEKLEHLKFFRKLMFEYLTNAYDDYDPDLSEQLSSFPVLKSWVIFENTVGMYLSNGTLQINFMDDHIKLILCPIVDSVTIIANRNRFVTFQLDLIKIYGCEQLLFKKLKASIKVIENLVEKFFRTWIMR